MISSSPIELPNNNQDILALADWLELAALTASDSNASAGDLENSLQIMLGARQAKEITLEVISEIDQRAIAADIAYPFTLRHSRVLESNGDIGHYIPYIFCLTLSYFGGDAGDAKNVKPRLLFEELCSIAARQYISGESVVFGTGRRSRGVISFKDAVNDLAQRLKEGRGIRDIATLNKKDDHVDLVAWRHFKDGREGKLILFGQCASGNDWEEKIGELNPDAFWSHWMVEAQISSMVRSFFVPHVLPYSEKAEWHHWSRYGGILFDRCRVAYWATTASPIEDYSTYSAWCNSCLRNYNSGLLF